VRFAFLNKGTLATNEQVQDMADAFAIQLAEHFEPAHNLGPSEVKFYANETDVPASTATDRVVKIAGFDDPDEPGALGWHTEDQTGAILAHVAYRPVLDNGGGVLDCGTSGCSIASVFSHEGVETRKNKNVNQYVDGPQIAQGSEYPEETADPCEMTTYPIVLPNGHVVFVSGFVTPEWFDAQTPAGTPTSYPEGATPGPFRLAAGGYCECRSEQGNDQPVFGDEAGIPVAPGVEHCGPPAWKLDMKRANPHSRINRHKHHHRTAA
jgi:hypothetical protein